MSPGKFNKNNNATGSRKSTPIDRQLTPDNYSACESICENCYDDDMLESDLARLQKEYYFKLKGCDIFDLYGWVK